MLENLPSQSDMAELLGQALFEVWKELCSAIEEKYDETPIYHDGKWVMFEPTNTAEFDDYMKMLEIKRKPDQKTNALEK